jgi:hypothetical protein
MRVFAHSASERNGAGWVAELFLRANLPISGARSNVRKCLWKRMFTRHSQNLSQSGIVGATANGKVHP